MRVIALSLLAASLAGPAAAQTPAAEGWTLRAVPGGAPVAVGGGAGSLRSVAAFCLEGRPWLALRFDPPPAGDATTVSFGFSSGEIDGAARREDGAGGAYVLELDDGPLAGSLAGSDSSVEISIDGQRQGALSLRGSSETIEAALAGCSP